MSLSDSRVVVAFRDLRDATTVAQAAECLDLGFPFVLAFDGVRVRFLPEADARDGFIDGLVLDLTTSGRGLP